MRGVLGRICAVLAVVVAPWLTGTAAAETALRIANGDRVLASLDEPGELDVYRISVPQGVDVRVRVRARRARHALDVSVSDAAARIRPGGRRGRATRIRLRDAVEGSYLVGVRSADGVATGEYRIDVSWPARRTLTLPVSVRSGPTDPADLGAEAGRTAAFAGVRGDILRLAVSLESGAYTQPYLVRLEAEDCTPGSSSELALGGADRAEVRLRAAAGRYAIVLGNRAATTGQALVRVALGRGQRRLDLRRVATPADVHVLVAEAIRPESGGELLGDDVDVVSALPGEAPLSASLDGLHAAAVRIAPGSVTAPATWVLALAPAIDPGVPGVLAAGPALLVADASPAFGGGLGAEIVLPCDVNPPRVFTRHRDGTVAEIAPEDLEVGWDCGRVVRFRAQVPATFQAFEQRPRDESVALAASDERLVIGVPGDVVDGQWNAGAVYVYLRSGAAWLEETRIVAEEPSDSGAFGSEVALSADTLVAKDSTATRVYVLVKGTGWTLEDELRNADGTRSLTWSTSIDGDTIAAGGERGAPASRGVRVFARQDGTWTEQQWIPAPAGDAFLFGTHVDVAGDRLIAGGLEMAAGAWVYARHDGVWGLEAHLRSGVVDGRLSAVAIDADTAAVGAVYEDTLGLLSGGEVSVFRRAEDAWIGVGVLPRPVELGAFEREIQFGRTLDLRGGRLLVGASADETQSKKGRAYVFDDDGSGFVHLASLFALPSRTQQSFGSVLALTPDGTTAIVGPARTTAGPGALPGCDAFDVEREIDEQ